MRWAYLQIRSIARYSAKRTHFLITIDGFKLNRIKYTNVFSSAAITCICDLTAEDSPLRFNSWYVYCFSSTRHMSPIVIELKCNEFVHGICTQMTASVSPVITSFSIKIAQVHIFLAFLSCALFSIRASMLHLSWLINVARCEGLEYAKKKNHRNKRREKKPHALFSILRLHAWFSAQIHEKQLCLLLAIADKCEHCVTHILMAC